MSLGVPKPVVGDRVASTRLESLGLDMSDKFEVEKKIWLMMTASFSTACQELARHSNISAKEWFDKIFNQCQAEINDLPESEVNRLIDRYLNERASVEKSSSNDLN